MSMSGMISNPRTRSGIINRSVTETVTLYHQPTQSNSGQTISFITFDNVRTWSPNYSSWMSYSGEDVTLQPGLYDLTFQMTNDHIGDGVGYHHRIYCRTSGTSSPGLVISQGYGTASGTHSQQPTLSVTLPTPVEVKVKVATRDGSDGHSLYFGGGSDQTEGSFTFFQIIRHNDIMYPLSTFDQNDD